MEVTKLNVEFSDNEYEIEKGVPLEGLVVKHIFIDHKLGLILIEFEEGSNWESKIIYTHNLESISYSGVTPPKKANIH